MHIHFIAIGGSIMHNLAIASQRAGHTVTGSDDEIYEPSRSALDTAGLLPGHMGWQPSRITGDIDRVILGMHAKRDNPELRAALEAGLTVQSFPEYVAEQSTGKQRVVVAGSHGKTTTTAMIMHVLRTAGRDFDYLVGAKLPGWELMVRLSDAPLIVIEGDEYLSSALDRDPKFLHYKPHISAITGIAWDHMNVFPTYEVYKVQFARFLASVPEDAKVFVFERDAELAAITEESEHNAEITPYGTFPHFYKDGKTFAEFPSETREVQFFGAHNFQNMEAARRICRELGVSERVFMEAMGSYTGAAMRLENIFESDRLTVYRDFAHAPSKVMSTVNALRERYPGEHIAAFLELHTYSSLNKDFLPLYAGSMENANTAIVFYSPHTLKMKKLAHITPGYVVRSFGGNVEVFTEVQQLERRLKDVPAGIHIWMSSGRLGGLELDAIYPGVAQNGR